MDHNEISAMYRDVLKVIGVKEERLTIRTTYGQFWDEHIYKFAEQWKNRHLDYIQIPLLLNAIYSLYELSFQEDVNG